MIEDSKYREILDSGLILDHYFLLCNIKNGIKPVDSKRIQGFINLLTKKDYIKDDVLTEKGLLLVENCSFSQVVVTDDKENKVDFGTWAAGLHVRLQEKLKELTGSTQMRAQIDRGKAYSFLPNATDLAKVLHRVITAYKLKDYDKIEKALMKYIEECKDRKNWFPILQYYIMKDGTSRLVTALESEQEETSEYKSTQKFI